MRCMQISTAGIAPIVLMSNVCRRSSLPLATARNTCRSVRLRRASNAIHYERIGWIKRRAEDFSIYDRANIQQIKTRRSSLNRCARAAMFRQAECERPRSQKKLRFFAGTQFNWRSLSEKQFSAAVCATCDRAIPGQQIRPSQGDDRNQNETR